MWKGSLQSDPKMSENSAVARMPGIGLGMAAPTLIFCPKPLQTFLFP